MVYHSLFDAILHEDPTFRAGFDEQKYHGTLDEVLSETEEILCSGSRSRDAVKLALHPSRIIRAFVDYKVQHLGEEAELLLRDAVQLGLDVYKGKDSAVSRIRELRTRTKESGNEGVLKRELKQSADIVTWDATHPSKSKNTVGNLVAMTDGEEVLFVALAHGGVAAGMDVYLRYCDYTGSNGSEFYVARFSACKSGDLTPRLSSREAGYLRELAPGKEVVIFDEDRASGETLDKAHKFFSRIVFPSRKVIILTNLDMISKLKGLGLEENLIKISSSGSKYKEKHKLINKLYIDNVIKFPEGNLNKFIITKKEKACLCFY